VRLSEFFLSSLFSSMRPLDSANQHDLLIVSSTGAHFLTFPRRTVAEYAI